MTYPQTNHGELPSSVTSKSRWGSLSKVLTVMQRQLQLSARQAVEASSHPVPEPLS